MSDSVGDSGSCTNLPIKKLFFDPIEAISSLELLQFEASVVRR